MIVPIAARQWLCLESNDVIADDGAGTLTITTPQGTVYTIPPVLYTRVRHMLATAVVQQAAPLSSEGAAAAGVQQWSGDRPGM